MAWSNSWFTDKGCHNKDEYSSKTVRRTDKKIATYWTQIIWLPSHKQTAFQTAEKDEKWTKVCEVLQNIYLSWHATCPRNHHLFKSQRVNSCSCKKSFAIVLFSLEFKVFWKCNSYVNVLSSRKIEWCFVDSYGFCYFKFHAKRWQRSPPTECSHWPGCSQWFHVRHAVNFIYISPTHS